MAQRFSLRMILAIVAFSGVASLVLSAWYRGYRWPVAIIMSLVGLGLVVGVHALLFFMAQLYSSMMKTRDVDQGQNPFATEPPPQILPVQDPEV